MFKNQLLKNKSSGCPKLFLDIEDSDHPIVELVCVCGFLLSFPSTPFTLKLLAFEVVELSLHNQRRSF
jgi:hypothetical protein